MRAGPNPRLLDLMLASSWDSMCQFRLEPCGAGGMVTHRVYRPAEAPLHEAFHWYPRYQLKLTPVLLCLRRLGYPTEHTIYRPRVSAEASSCNGAGSAFAIVVQDMLLLLLAQDDSPTMCEVQPLGPIEDRHAYHSAPTRKAIRRNPTSQIWAEPYFLFRLQLG